MNSRQGYHFQSSSMRPGFLPGASRFPPGGSRFPPGASRHPQGPGHYHPCASRFPPSQPGRTSSSQFGAPSRGNPSMSTRTRPGQPHFTGMRANRSAGRLEHTVCRCHNPDSHGDAWTFIDDDWADDPNGNHISWSTGMNRILDLYGKSTMTRDEELAKYPEIMTEECVRYHFTLEHGWDDAVRRGIHLEISPFSTWHNEDGHRRPFLTDEGARTVFPGGSQLGGPSRRSGGPSQNPGHPGSSRGVPSMGFR
jgi:hypothetical protein